MDASCTRKIPFQAGPFFTKACFLDGSFRLNHDNCFIVAFTDMLVYKKPNVL